MYGYILFSTIICTSSIRWTHGYGIEDEQSCNHSLVFALKDQPTLIRFDLATRDFYVFTPTTNLLSPMALAVDHEDGFVFFSDIYYEQVYRFNFKNGSDTVVIKDLPEGSYVDGMAVDPILRKLFYTDFAFLGEPQDYDISYAAIRSMDYDGDNTVTILNENDNLKYPRAIIVDTNMRTIYYTDWGDPPHISAVAYNGSNNHVVLNMGLIMPNGLAEDFANNRIYYCDAGSDTVGVINTDGTNNRIIYVNYVAVLTHFFHIIRVNDSLFVTNWDGEATTSARTTIVVIEMDLDGDNARVPITMRATRAVKATGIVDICFPADQSSALIDSSDVTFNPIITFPSTTPLQDSTTEFRSTTTSTEASTISRAAVIEDTEDEPGSSGDSQSRLNAIIIGMVLLAVISIITIVSTTVCCLYRKRMRTLRTEVEKTSISQHDSKAFERTEYLTPVATSFPSQYLTIVPEPPYRSNEYLTIPDSAMNNYTRDTIYETIKD